LLKFVGLYGTTLAPVGAIILAEVYLARKFRFSSDWAEKTGSNFNFAVLLAWVIPLAAFYVAVFKYKVFPSYLTLPVYILTAVIYVVIAKMLHKTPLASESQTASAYATSR
jgi:NCS1 family nucleobase:cation symporter-1